MTNLIQNTSDATRRLLCFASAVVIVSTGLMLGAIGADAVYQSALAHSTSQQIA